MTSPADDEPVPRLPRGRGMKLDGAMMMRIGMTLLLLVMVVLTARPCANAASSFVTGFDQDGSGSTTPPQPGTIDIPPASRGTLDEYELLRPEMTEAEQRAVIERAKAKARAAAGSAAPAGAAPRAGSADGSGSSGRAAPNAVGSGSQTE